MQCYELKARLNHLTLVGVDDEKQLEWIGTQQQWEAMRQEETKHYE